MYVLPSVGGAGVHWPLESSHCPQRGGEAESSPRPGRWIPCAHGAAGITQTGEEGQHGALLSPLPTHSWLLVPECFGPVEINLLACLSLVSQMVKNSPAMQERPKLNLWFGKIPWRREWQPTPVFLPGKSRELRSLVGYSPWSRRQSDMTE